MQHICIDCHHIGKGKDQLSYNKVDILIYLVPALICTVIAFIYPIALIGTFILIFALTGILSSPYAFVDQCPECSKIMYPIDSPQAQKVIRDNDINYDASSVSRTNFIDRFHKIRQIKTQICLNCQHIGVGRHQEICNLMEVFLNLPLAIITIPLAYITPYSLIGSFLFAYLGLGALFQCFVKSDTCPICKKKKMISLTSSEADRFIKNNNIEFQLENADTKPFFLNETFNILVFTALFFVTLYYYYILFVHFSNGIDPLDMLYQYIYDVLDNISTRL